MGEQHNDVSVDAKFIQANSLLYGLHVHQATGMVAVQADCPMTAAVALLVDHATAHGLSIEQTAHDVVDRRLRFD